MAFTLKGSSSDRAPRQTKSLAFKAAVLIDVKNGATPKVAMTTQCAAFGYEMTPSMDKYAHSAMFQFRKSVMGAVAKGNQDIIDVLTAADMLEETPDVTEESAPAADSTGE